MAITAETLLELVNDARDARLALERQIAEIEAKVEELHTQREELEEEEQGYMATLQRRFPQAVPAAQQDDDENTLLPGFVTKGGVPSMPRTAAVQMAIDVLDEANGHATPAGIEAWLHERGRDDDRDQIGGAIAHLNRTGKIHSVGRGMWKIGAGS